MNDYDSAANATEFHGSNGMSVEQVTWVVNTALAEDDRRIIFVSHQTYDTEMDADNQSVFAAMQRLFTSIANKTTYSYGTLTHDYTNTGLTFVAHLCGHYHADADNKNTNVLTIQTTCDKLNGTRTAGTVDEQAFDVVSVNYDESKIYLTRIGAGSDREFSFAVT